MKPISVKSRAELIRNDFYAYDLHKWTDEELVSVWNDWFMTNNDNDSLESFIAELNEICPK